MSKGQCDRSFLQSTHPSVAKVRVTCPFGERFISISSCTVNTVVSISMATLTGALSRINPASSGNRVRFSPSCGPGSSVGITTELRAGRSGDRILVGARFSAHPDRPWGPPSLLYNGYRFFHGGKLRPGRAADHSPPSSAEVYPPVGHNWACNGVTLLYFCPSFRLRYFISECVSVA